MKVEIIKCSLDTYWYADRIGSIFNVIEKFKLFNKHCVYRVIYRDKEAFINCDDVRVLN